jgi:CRP/FNR family transcriptional regulator
LKNRTALVSPSVPDLPGSSNFIANPSIEGEPVAIAPMNKERRKPPIRLKTFDCAACSSRGPDWFCSLGTPVLADFALATDPIAIPAHTVLFSQGEHTPNLYIVCDGFLKITIGSADRQAIVRVAGPGSLLGLHAALSGPPSEVSAVALTTVRLRLIDRERFLAFLRTHREAQRMATKCLCEEYSYVLEDFSRIALAATVGGRLSRLLLKLARQIGEPLPEGGIRFPVLLSHEELASMIDATRETVTRLLCRFRKEGWISIDRSQVIVHDSERLKLFSLEQHAQELHSESCCGVEACSKNELGEMLVSPPA